MSEWRDERFAELDRLILASGEKVVPPQERPENFCACGTPVAEGKRVCTACQRKRAAAWSASHAPDREQERKRLREWRRRNVGR